MTAQEYFNSHSLNPEFLQKRFGVIWDDKKITFPVYDAEGKLLYCRIRHLDHGVGTIPKFTFSPPGSHPALFCVHKIKKLDAVILCEGEPDAVRLWQEGLAAVTSTSGVKSFSPVLADPLKGKKVYLCLDTDESGIGSIRKYGLVLQEAGIETFIVELPPQFKDVCEYFTAGNTKQDFLELQKTALPFSKWLANHQDEKYKIISAADILARQLPPEDWYIDRIIPTEGFVFLVGTESTGKSYQTLSLAESLTTGKPWLDVFEVKKQTKVLFIDKENTMRRTQKRLRGLKIEPNEKMFWLEYPQFFDLTDPESDDGFSEFAKIAVQKVKDEGIGTIVIDSFADIMTGNENAASDTQEFFDDMRQLFPGITIIVLHHENKPSQGVSRTSSQKVRGSSNIMAQIVIGFRVAPLPKTTNEFSMEQIKSGDAPKMNKFKVILVSGPDPQDEAKTIVIKIEHGGEIIDEDLKMEEAIDFILEILEEESPMKRHDLFERCGGQGFSESTCRRAVKKLVEEEKISEAQDPEHKQKKIYFFTENRVQADFEEN